MGARGAQHQVGLQLAVALIPFWTMHGHYWDAQTWLTRASTGQGATSGGARALWGLGHMRLLGMHVESGYGYGDATEALALAQASEDETTAVRARAHLALLETLIAPGAGDTRLTAALDLARNAADDWAVSYLLVYRAFAKAMFSEQHDDAGPVIDELRRDARRVGNASAERAADGLDALGRLRRGQLADARGPLERALADAREHGDPFAETISAMNMADLEIAEGCFEAARQLVAESRTRLSRSARGRIETLDLKLATALLAEGAATDALTVCEDLSPTVDQLAMPSLVCSRQLLMGRAFLETGQADRACAALDEALLVARFADNPWLESGVLHHQAVLRRALGDHATAEDLHHQALAVGLEHGFRSVVADSLEGLAGIAIVGESWAEGVRLAAGAATWRDASGCRAWAIDEHRLQADLDVAHAQLGDDAWEQACKEGVALDLDHAVSYATRARGERRRPTTGWASLTPTETNVVHLVADGLSNPDIAARLFISRATVKTHLVHVFTKLGVVTRSELAAKATRHGV